MSAPVRFAGTDDPVEIAAVLAALARRIQPPEPNGYERWRQQRARALRASRGR